MLWQGGIKKGKFMNKFLCIAILSVSIFDILSAGKTFTLPAWFKKHKIYNLTEYPIMVRAMFTGYDSPSTVFKSASGTADSVGLLIESKSDSSSATIKLFEIGEYGDDADNSLTAIGVFKPNQSFIAFSEPIINPKEKDYTVRVRPATSSNPAAQFILEEKK